MELDAKPDGVTLWTSVVVVCRECLLRRSGEQIPHVARRIDGFLDDRTPAWTLSAVYERIASGHCMRLLEDRRPAVEPLCREWEFSDVAAQAARRGDLSSLKWLAESYMPDGSLSPAASAAAASGELQTLQWLMQEHKTRVHWGGVEWSQAIRGGQTDVIEWLRRQVTPHEDAAWTLVFDAANAGYLELVQWMLAQYGSAVNAALRGAHKGHQWRIVECAMRDAVLGCHIQVMLFLYKNHGHEVCEEGICLLREDWEDTELRFVGMAQWLLEKFGHKLEGVTFSVNRADWAANKWMKEHNMQQLDVEDEFIFWESGPASL
ncbi:Ankyrin repeat and SAM domain-containing protein 3 [Phytophthora pseudosyringae]|uniref:Ankyrin repeat and SAM domain-containing protein 3 n=1 Tax=Phytophthora pseudosyringae TaxID=221518 RepID=A0A8T1VKN2_9STRA|nr:Ankyrin repeat and SAM domain-containing protein 3 [Phytophthora pseudosyringae]